MWSAVQGVGAGSESEALQALEQLAVAYWPPLYVFARQRGADHHGAADQVQGFFEHLLSGEVLRRVERRESRFRSFLLAAFQNWLANRHERAAAQKRGGGAVQVALAEFDSAQSDLAMVTDESPERCFDRRWARAVFDHAVARLDAEVARKDRPEFFAELRRRLTGPQAASPDWEEVARRFGMKANAVKQAAHALRQRLGTLVKQEVRAVVSTEADLDDEFRYLIQLLSAPADSA
jgi:RNA polymerase sigma-70 factor (ECF subfamily)